MMDMTLSDLRREPRLRVEVPVSAVVLGDPDIRFQCQLVDVSESGARLLMSGPVPMDAVIKIEWAEHFLLGSPRYIKRTSSGYFVGLQLNGCSQWHGKASVSPAVCAGRHAPPPMGLSVSLHS
jgi:hypothetical protein